MKERGPGMPKTIEQEYTDARPKSKALYERALLFGADHEALRRELFQIT